MLQLFVYLWCIYNDICQQYLKYIKLFYQKRLIPHLTARWLLNWISNQLKLSINKCIFVSRTDGPGVHKSFSVSGRNKGWEVSSARRECSWCFYRLGEKRPQDMIIWNYTRCSDHQGRWMSCKISCSSRYLMRRSLWSGGITTGPVVSDWSALTVIYNFSFANMQQSVCTLNPHFSNLSSVVCSFQSIMQQSPWRLWTWAVRRSWRWSTEVSRTMRRSGQKKAGRDTTLRLSNRLLALGRGCSEDRVL